MGCIRCYGRIGCAAPFGPGAVIQGVGGKTSQFQRNAQHRGGHAGPAGGDGVRGGGYTSM